jgi:hypothetical protein
MKRTTSGLPFAIALAVLLLFAAGAVRAQADSNDGKVLTITTKRRGREREALQQRSCLRQTVALRVDAR